MRAPVYVPRHSYSGHTSLTEDVWVLSLASFVVSALFLVALLSVTGWHASLRQIRDQGLDIRRWWRDPWRRHGQLLAGLPLTRAVVAVGGDLVAVTGRVVGGGPTEGVETEALQFSGHVIIDDGSNVLLRLGRVGSRDVAEPFSIGDTVFAVGEVDHAEDAGGTPPFRVGERVVALVPGSAGLFLVVRGPRDLACVMLAEREAKLRLALRPTGLAITATVCLASGILCLALR